MTSDPRTPVIVGVGQAAERVGDAGYRGMSAVDLATAAVQAALLDCAAPHCGAVTEAIDVVAGTRQFEITGRDGPGVLGRSTNYPRSVANRVGAGSARAVLDVVGGQGPQRLLNEFAAAIAAGDIVSRRGATSGCAEGEVGLLVRSRRHDRATSACPPGSRPKPYCGNGCARSVVGCRGLGGRDRHLRSLQLFPHIRFRHARPPRNRTSRLTRLDLDWRPALPRWGGNQLRD